MYGEVSSLRSASGWPLLVIVLDSLPRPRVPKLVRVLSRAGRAAPNGHIASHTPRDPRPCLASSSLLAPGRLSVGTGQPAGPGQCTHSEGHQRTKSRRVHSNILLTFWLAMRRWQTRPAPSQQRTGFSAGNRSDAPPSAMSSPLPALAREKMRPMAGNSGWGCGHPMPRRSV